MTTMRRGPAMLGLVLAIAIPCSARAAVFNVAPGDVAGLIAAIETANANGEADTINLAAGTYALAVEYADQTGLPEITSQIDLIGAGAASTVVTRTGLPGFRLLRVAASGRLRVEGLTLSEGAATQSGGGIRSEGELTVVDCILTGNSAAASPGGAIYHASSSPLVIEASTLSSNSAGTGGALFASGPFVMRGSQVLSNSTGFSGEVRWQAPGAGVPAYGRIEDSLIQGNADVGVFAGALENVGSVFEVVRTTIDGNAGGGMGISGDALWVFVSDSTISNNTSTTVGAGIDAHAKLVLRRSTVSGNSVGGAMQRNGGGISVGADVTIESSTLSGNSATASGGGIYLSQTLPKQQGVHIRASTITGNRADSDGDTLGSGGGIASLASGIEIQDSILADNLDLLGNGRDCVGPLASDGHNLIGDLGSCAYAPGPGDVTGVAAALAPLAANGGPTQTHLPLAGSPAIDAADPERCGAPDQRVFARPLDGDGNTVAACDIGAIEAGAATPVVFLSDHFLCHGAARSAGTPDLPALDGVTLADDIETKPFDVQKTKTLCTPADKNAEGIADEATHLHGRAILEDAGQPRHLRQVGLRLANQLGAFTIDTVKADRLLVPAAKGLGAFLPPPDPMAHDLDRYKCYVARTSTGAPKLPRRAAALRVALANQFTDGRVLQLNKVTRLCTAVDQQGLGRKNPAAHLVCYQARAEKPGVVGDDESTIKGLYVSSAWGNERVDAKRLYEVCVPSLLLP